MRITLIKGEIYHYEKDVDYDNYKITDGLFMIYKIDERLICRDVAIFPIRNIASIIFD